MRLHKRKIFGYLLIILYWLIVVNFLSLFSMYSILSFLNYANIEVESLKDTLAIYWISPNQFVEGILFGIFFGILFIVIHEIANKYHWDRLGFGRVIILKSVLYLAGFSIIFIVIYVIIDSLGFYPDNILTTIAFHPEMAVILEMLGFYIFTNIVLLNYIIQTNKKIGDNNIVSFLTGKYRKPILEDRLFMFVDLKSSTSIAEKLGNTKYSRLIRDCFEDLNYIVTNYSFDIYQYVGDEVVITGVRHRNNTIYKLISLYFDFNQRILERGKYYEKQYDLVPFFKAGIHAGRISVTEIGTVRRDIAYHGDVINTTARIQELCNRLDQMLLVSATSLNGMIRSLNGYQIESMGSFQLKGKKEETEIMAISLRGDSS